MAGSVTVEVTEAGVLVFVDGTIRATFTGDPATADGLAALEELLHELFGVDVPPAIRFMQGDDLT